SVRVVSTWRLMVERLIWFSFCSRGVIGFLSRVENEGVILQQRERVGGEIVQPWVAQAEGRLCLSRRLLLAKNVGHVVGAEGAGRGSFVDGLGDRRWRLPGRGC